MPSPQIDQEEIDLKRVMFMEESELNAMRVANIRRYESLLKELEVKEKAYLDRLANIQAEIDVMFKEREDSLIVRMSAVKEAERVAGLMNEEMKGLLRDAEDERGFVKKQREYLNALESQLRSRILVFNAQIEALEVTRENYRTLVNDLAVSIQSANVAKEKAENDLNNAKDKLLYATARVKAADELFKVNQAESQRLAVLIDDANKKYQKAQEIIKKMGPRWQTREA